VLVGAVGTALLFTIDKQLLGLYLEKASVGSTYGAAGSLVAVVVWIYYSAQIFFFGAEFTHVYAEAHPVENQPTAKETGPTSALGPVRPQQVVQTGEVPMRMAAATIGSTSLVCLPVPTPTAPVSSQAGGSLPQPNTGSAETTPLHERRGYSPLQYQRHWLREQQNLDS